MKKILEKLSPRKKSAKKTAGSAKKAEEPACDPRYNEFGVCLACNGGNPDCVHNNLTTVGRSLVCVTCGITVS